MKIRTTGTERPIYTRWRPRSRASAPADIVHTATVTPERTVAANVARGADGATPTSRLRGAYGPSPAIWPSGVRPGQRLTLAQTRAQVAVDRSLERVGLIAPTAVRLSLALVFIWFGVLKIAGDSPVAALISATIPIGQPALVVHTLGFIELGLGIGLLIGRAQRLLLLAVAAHLAGTLTTFVMAPGLTVQHGNPFLLTADGEFVLKNLVLISAAVLLLTYRTGLAKAAVIRAGVETSDDS